MQKTYTLYDNKITACKLSDFTRVRHAFFTRKGGVSDPPYDTLNCGLMSKDAIDKLLINLRIVETSFDYPFVLKVVTQTHSNKVVLIHGAKVDTELQLSELKVGDSECEESVCGIHAIKHDSTHLIQADAIVTKLDSILIGVQTADCVPILFYDVKYDIIGAAHAGWRGAFSGVIENTVNAMLNLGGAMSKIIAIIGPSIRQPNYEVDNAFYSMFVDYDILNGQYFIPSKTGYFMFDLQGYCKFRLLKSGICQVDDLLLDTYASPELFFSCRYAKQDVLDSDRNDIYFGSQLSVIGMLPKIYSQ
ncbi:polyphenol oxidase [Alphaproteobacteria bacterium]